MATAGAEESFAATIGKAAAEKAKLRNASNRKELHACKEAIDALCAAAWPPSEGHAMELEVRFGTLPAHRSLKQVDLDNVLALCGGGGGTVTTEMLLRVSVPGSPVRMEVRGEAAVRRMMERTGGWRNLTEEDLTDVTFCAKGAETKDHVDVEMYQFRVCLTSETQVSHVDAWNALTATTATCRLLHRSSVQIGKARVEASVVRQATRVSGLSQVLGGSVIYELEIEVTEKVNAADLLAMVKPVLCALQQGPYPVPYAELADVRDEFNTLTTATKRTIFLGPSSVSLERDDAGKLVQYAYTVTDKADGARCLLYVSASGRVYSLSLTDEFAFTGVEIGPPNTPPCGSVIDAEMIATAGGQRYYLCFDAYFVSGRDVRLLPFMEEDTEDKDAKEKETRYTLLQRVLADVVAKGVDQGAEKGKDKKRPLIHLKTFLPNPECRMTIEEAVEAFRDEWGGRGGGGMYATDGLVFTPCRFGVGQTPSGAPPAKVWPMSFKWKPVQTIDFLVQLLPEAMSQTDGHTVYRMARLLVGASSPSLTSSSPMENVPPSFNLAARIRAAKDHFVAPPQPSPQPSAAAAPSSLPPPSTISGYTAVQFMPTEPADAFAGLCGLPVSWGGAPRTVGAGGAGGAGGGGGGDVITNMSVVEFRLDTEGTELTRWVPLRVRHEKKDSFGNSWETANNVWRAIHKPVTMPWLLRALRRAKDGGAAEDEEEEEVEQKARAACVYYAQQRPAPLATNVLREFHNAIKADLLGTATGLASQIDDLFLVDLGCGKAGDLSKWIYNARIRTVLGIDAARNNLEDKADGAWVRYFARDTGITCVFAAGDCAKRIIDGTCSLAQADKHVLRHAFRFLGGAHIVNCHFAIHYMFASPATLAGFLTNVAETTRIGGVFTATCYDGAAVHAALTDQASIEHWVNDALVFAIHKRYAAEEFLCDPTSIGLAVDVFQESIGVPAREYLVSITYLTALMELVGFEVAQITPFRDHATRHPCAARMSAEERVVSFWNVSCMFLKKRELTSEQLGAVLNRAVWGKRAEKAMIADTQKKKRAKR